MRVITLGCKDYPAFSHAKDVGGIETFCNDILPRIKDSEFIVLTRRYKNSSKQEKLGNVSIIRVPFLNLPMLQTFTFNFLAFFKALRIDAEVIWAHEPVAGFYAYWFSKFTKKPYILHIHSRGHLEPANSNRAFWLKVMEHFAYKSPKKVIFVSAKISQDLNKPGQVIPIGINIDKFKHAKIDSELEKIPGKKICYLGRLSKVKGISYLLESFSKLNLQDASLVIVGDGSEKNNLIDHAKSLGIQNKVFFLGYKPAETILPFIDLFVLPSLSEGMPHTILETIACKKVIVATKVGEVPSMLTDYLANPGDSESLALAITLAMKEKKRQSLDHKFLIDNVAKELAQALA